MAVSVGESLQVAVAVGEAVLVAVSTFGTTNGAILTGPRVTQAMAADGPVVFDLGGSDRKCAALIDGKVVFSDMHVSSGSVSGAGAAGARRSDRRSIRR